MSRSIAFSLLLLICACSPSGAKRPPVILVVVDTLRFDLLSSSGGEQGIMPHLDEWAKDAVVFTSAYSQAPWTLPSFASLFTSTYPVEHGAKGKKTDDNRHTMFEPMKSDLLTAPQSFQSQGYFTGAIVNNIFLKGDFGFSKGFDTYDFYPASPVEYRKAEEVTGLGIRWIDERADGSGPFFLMLHYFDPHFTYRPPAKFAKQFGGSFTGAVKKIRSIEDVKRGKVKLNQWDKDNMYNLYRGEAAYTDRELKRFFDHLREKKLLEGSVVIVTSDHGEEFWDHGDFEHGHTQYEELVKVPLLIRFPGGQHGGKVVDEPVRLMDLMPTVHEVLDLGPPSTFRGESFLGLIDGKGKASKGPLVFEACLYGNEKKALRVKNLKLIVNLVTNGLELYDLETDPLERENLVSSRSEEAEKLKSTLFLLLDELERDQVEGPVDLPEDLMEKLEQLGYVDKGG